MITAAYSTAQVIDESVNEAIDSVTVECPTAVCDGQYNRMAYQIVHPSEGPKHFTEYDFFFLLFSLLDLNRDGSISQSEYTEAIALLDGELSTRD